MESSYNARCPAVKRLFREAKELHECTEEYYAQPLDDNLFEWHFTVRGPVDTEFDGGIYHGRIILPADYPMKPPNIIFLTANGRFETNKKICLSISGHHPETWQPSWSIRTALLAIIGFMPTSANGTIGSLDYTAPERQVLAKKSEKYECPECGGIVKLLKERTGSNTELQEEARKVMTECSFTNPGDKKTSESSDKGSENASPNKESPTAEEVNSTDSSGVGNSENVTNGATGVQSIRTEATSQANLPGSTTTPQEQREEILMEGAQPQGRSSSQQPQQRTATTYGNQQQQQQQTIQTNGSFYNGVLSAAICLFIALVLRRIFMLEHDGGADDMEEVLL